MIDCLNQHVHHYAHVGGGGGGGGPVSPSSASLAIGGRSTFSSPHVTIPFLKMASQFILRVGWFAEKRTSFEGMNLDSTLAIVKINRHQICFLQSGYTILPYKRHMSQ